MDPVSFAPVIHRLVRSAFVWLGSLLLASLLLIGLPGEAHALTCTRQIEQDFDLRGWDEPSRWNCGLVPRPGDTAILPRIAPALQLPPNLALNRDLSIARFEMYSGRLEGNYTMTVTQEMIWGAGNLHYINVPPFVSPAKTVIAPGAALKVRIDALDISSSGTFENLGEIHWQTAPFTLTTPRILGNKVINRGTFSVDTAGEEWNTTVENLGTLVVNTKPGPHVTLNNIQNSGRVALHDDLRAFTYEQITGTTTLTDVALIIPDFTNGLLLRGGRLHGRGTVAGHLNNRAGVVAPTGLLRLDSGFEFLPGYTQGPTATLALEIAGTRRGADYGSLQIKGITAISGTLSVTFTDGFVPDADDGFIVAVCAPACTGQFAANTSGLPIHYNDDYIVIGANIPLPADPKLYLPTLQSSQ